MGTTTEVIESAVHVLHVMGLPFSIHLRGPGARGSRAAEQVRQEHADLVEADRVFSTYRPGSDISRIDRGLLAVVDADPEVAEVLALADRARAETSGLFSVYLPGPDGRLRFDPSGLVKGWAAQRAFDTLMEVTGIDVCLNAGGDVAVGTRAPGRVWRIGVEDPVSGGLLGVVPMTAGALATSGTAARGDHILDPRTGGSPSALRQVSVLGPALAWADVLARGVRRRGRRPRPHRSSPGLRGHRRDLARAGALDAGYAAAGRLTAAALVRRAQAVTMTFSACSSAAREKVS